MQTPNPGRNSKPCARSPSRCGIHEGGACTCGKHTPVAQAESQEDEELETPETFQTKAQDQAVYPARAEGQAGAGQAGPGQPGPGQPGPGQPGYHKSRKVKRKKTGRSPWTGDGETRGSRSRPTHPGGRPPGAPPKKKATEPGKPPKA